MTEKIISDLTDCKYSGEKYNDVKPFEYIIES